MQGHEFSREQLLITLQDAEELAARVEDLPEGNQQMHLIYRWAEVADKVALLMVQAEEQLPADELENLRATINEPNALRWESYRRNIRWMNQPPE
jgi:DNA transposition AAA+ family ATPase